MKAFRDLKNWQMQLLGRDCSTTESWVADIILSLEQLLVGIVS